MRFFTVLSLMLFMSMCAIAQKQKLVFNGGHLNQLLISSYYVVEEEEEEVNTYHYLYPAWHPGSLEFIDGSTKENIYLNYNLLKGTVEELVNGELQVYSIYQVKRFRMIDFEAGDYVTYLGVNALIEGEGTRSCFVRLVADGPTKLIERAFFEVTEHGTYYRLTQGDDEPSKVRRLYLFEHNVLKPLKKAKSFAPYKQQIKAFVKSNRLYWTEEADLIRIVAYYNSLSQPGIPLKSPLVAF